MNELMTFAVNFRKITMRREAVFIKALQSSDKNGSECVRKSSTAVVHVLATCSKCVYFRVTFRAELLWGKSKAEFAFLLPGAWKK